MNPSPAEADPIAPQEPASLRGLRGGTNESFVRNAYRQLLGREPDAEGYGNCLEELGSGASRMQVLAAIARSPEGVARSVARGDPGNLVVAIEAAHRAMSPPAAASYDQLVSYADERFVRCAYLTVLGREADPGGLAHYLGQVRAGLSKATILASLCESPERRERSRRLSGNRDATRDGALPGILRRVAGAARRNRWRKVPIVGFVLGAILDWERDDEQARTLRRIENRVSLLVEERMESHFLQEAPGAYAPGAARATEDGGIAEGVVARPAVHTAALLRTLPALSRRGMRRTSGAAS